MLQEGTIKYADYGSVAACNDPGTPGGSITGEKELGATYSSSVQIFRRPVRGFVPVARENKTAIGFWKIGYGTHKH
jgi:hypothetical protein